MCRAIGRRFADIGLQLHSNKTRIVFCKDDRRRLDHELVTFTFCGTRFAPVMSGTRYFNIGEQGSRRRRPQRS